MKISIPFINSAEFIDDANIDFYNAVQIPMIQGGRDPFFTTHITPTLDETIKLIEQYGSRYKVLATSTEPEWNDNVKKLCDCLNKNNGILVVTDLGFATKVKEKYPNIRLHSSCIAGLKYPFEMLLNSSLFEIVGVPNIWHKYYDRILDNVPLIHRNRVIIIVLKYCIWDKRCWDHYIQISKWYKEGNNNGQYDKCHQRRIMIDLNSKPRDLIRADRLFQNGFRYFKLAGRIALNLDYDNGVKLIRERIAEIKKDIGDRQ
jgi:hypothetical protein